MRVRCGRSDEGSPSTLATDPSATFLGCASPSLPGSRSAPSLRPTVRSATGCVSCYHEQFSVPLLPLGARCAGFRPVWAWRGLGPLRDSCALHARIYIPPLSAPYRPCRVPREYDADAFSQDGDSRPFEGGGRVLPFVALTDRPWLAVASRPSAAEWPPSVRVQQFPQFSLHCLLWVPDLCRAVLFLMRRKNTGQRGESTTRRRTLHLFPLILQ